MSEPQILTPGRPATEDEVTKNVKATRQSLIDNGWSVLYVGYSKAYFPPEVYQSGDNEGEEHGEKTVEQVWINAFHPDRKRTLNVTYYNDGFELCRWNPGTTFPGYFVSAREMGELIKGSWNDKLPDEQWKQWKADRAAENKALRDAAAERARLRKEAKENGSQ